MIQWLLQHNHGPSIKELIEFLHSLSFLDSPVDYDKTAVYAIRTMI